MEVLEVGQGTDSNVTLDVEEGALGGLHDPWMAKGLLSSWSFSLIFG